MQKELSIDLVKDEEVAILRDLAIQTFTETLAVITPMNSYKSFLNKIIP